MGSCKERISDWCYVYSALGSQEVKCTADSKCTRSPKTESLKQPQGVYFGFKSLVLPRISITQCVLSGMKRVKRQLGVRGRDLTQTGKCRLMLRTE